MALLIVLERYTGILSCLGVAISIQRLDQPYDAGHYGDVGELDVQGVACLLAAYGVSPAEAETWCAWACAYVEMDLEAHLTSSHAVTLRSARASAHERINTDLLWVIKQLNALAPSYYNPGCGAHGSRHQPAASLSTTAVTGPSLTTLDADVHMSPSPPDTPGENAIRVGYGDELSRETQMGPG